jgi:hypothetical protein
MQKKPITIADIVRIFGECEIQDERGIWMPINTIPNQHDYTFPTEKWREPDWKADKEFGEGGQQWIEDAFENNDGKTEIKTERDDGTKHFKQWKQTGNIAIEYANNKGELTGLWKDNMSIWIHTLSEKHGSGYRAVQSYIFYDIPKLRRFIKWLVDENRAFKPKSSPANAKIIVVPIVELEKYNSFT